ncbi:MAG: hypothetical protein MHMPM18_004297 [Marteilia pararefringens]
MAAGDLDGEITRLERLSIISKLSQELENHIDINDIDLGNSTQLLNFIISKYKNIRIIYYLLKVPNHFKFLCKDP